MGLVYEGIGDIWGGGIDLAVIPVNCAGAMGAGIALYVKRNFPDVYSRYRRDCEEELITHGVVYEYISVCGARLLLLPTKRHWRDPSRLEDISDALDDLKNKEATYNGLTIGFPPIGCGYGGLDYAKQVGPLLRLKLANCTFTSVILLPDM